MISIIIQGTSYSKESLNLIVESYLRYGFTDIVVSSYTWCVDEDYLKDKVYIVYNDHLVDKYQPSIDNFSVNPTQKIKRLNVNFQIGTTLAGIEKVKELFPTNKFVIKQRCDMMLLNIVECIQKNIEFLNHNPYTSTELEFDSYMFKDNIKSDLSWYMTDWFFLTTLNNLELLFNIPSVFSTSIKPERYIFQTYVKSINPTITWERFKQEHFKKWAIIPTLYWFRENSIVFDSIKYSPIKHKHLISM